MCGALKFIPATVNTELSALAQTYGMSQARSIPGTVCPHGTRFFPSALDWKQAVQEGKTSSLQFPFHPFLGSGILKGTA